MKTQKLDPAQVLAALQAGARDKEIARVQGVTRQRISQLRHRWGFPPNRVPLDPGTVGPMLSLGMSDRAVGARLGVSDSRINHMRESLGLPAAARIREERVREAKASHQSNEQIAKKLGLTLQTVGVIGRRVGYRQRAPLKLKVGRPPS